MLLRKAPRIACPPLTNSSTTPHFPFSTHMPGVWLWRREAHAGSCSSEASERAAVASALRAGRLGVAFSGAGFGAAYQLGVCQVLTALGILDTSTAVSGVSAGSVVAAAARCGLDAVDVLPALQEVSKEVMIAQGKQHNLAAALRRQLDSLLPSDAHAKCSTSAAPFVVGATRVRGCCPACWRPDVFEGGCRVRWGHRETCLLLRQPSQPDLCMCA